MRLVFFLRSFCLIIFLNTLFVNVFGQLTSLPTYNRTTSANFNYTVLDTGTSKNLYVRDFSTFVNLCNSGYYGSKSIKKATLNGILNLGDDYRFGNSTYHYDVTVTIQGYHAYSGTSPGPIFTESRTLTLDCNGSSCSPEQQFSIDFTSQYNQINRFVVTAAITSHSGLTTTQSYLDLDVYFAEDFLYSYSTIPSITLTPLAGTVNSNPVKFEWASACSFVPNYEFQLLRLYNVDASTSTTDSTIKAKVDWSQALSIETGSSLKSIKTTIAEGSGYYIWRVRPIGNAYEGGIANDRNWGPWNEDNVFVQDTLIDITISDSYSNLFFYNQFDNNKNWIYSRTFVEGDVRNDTPVNIGENITYANGLQMIKQKQVKLNTENRILVNQTIQDFSGRASLVTMAAPVDSVKLGYVNRYIKNSVDSLYTARDFDADNNYKNATSTAIGSNSLLAKYYSDVNTLDTTIPNADGFAFSRTLYFRDGTNRPREQSSPGLQHRIKVTAPDSVSHTVRNSYSSVADLELIRVLGDEAPAANSVHKMITVDANNSASVTYVSKEGQTIITCMSKPGSALLDTLSSQHSAGFTVIDTIANNVLYGTNGLSAIKNVCFTESTSLTLNYDILPATYGDTCSGICMSCDYKVTFFITSQDDDTTSNWNHSEVINPDSCAANALHTYTYSHTLSAGCYVIERRIEANTTNASTGNTYITDQDSVLNDTLTVQFNTGTGINLYTSTNVSMDTIHHFINNAQIDSLNTYLGVSSSDTTTVVSIVFNCDTLHIPIEHCDTHPCDSVIAFEEYLVNAIDSSSTIHDYIPAYTTGQFNSMISNMITAGYNCTDLWTCWQSLVLNYQNNQNMFTSTGSTALPPGLNPQPDLLNDFLNCTGYQIIGFTTTDFGTPGYLSHPFAYFNYSFTQKMGCEYTFCNGACDGTDTAAFTSTDWNNFYLCTKYNNSTYNTPGVTYELSTVQQMEDSCKSMCNQRFDAFVSSLVNLYEGDTIAVYGYEYPTPDSMPATDTLPLSTIYCQAQNLVNKCASQCNLTIFSHDGYATIDSVGTPAERTLFSEAMTYNYQLSRDSAGYCSGVAATSDSIDAVDLMVQFLNHQLQNVKDTTGRDGSSWNYLTPLTAFEPALASTSMYSAMNTHPNVYVQPDVPSYFIQSTSPDITRTDSITSAYFTYKRTIQKNIQPGKDFTVTCSARLKQNLDTASSISFNESINLSMLRLVSGTPHFTHHGPLTAGTEIFNSYVVHDSSALAADSTYANAISGNATNKDTTINLSSVLTAVACPTIYYYFNKAKTPDKAAPTVTVVSTSFPNPMVPGVHYTNYAHITVDSFYRATPNTAALAYYFTSSFSINMSAPNANYFTSLAKLRSDPFKGIKDTTHVYVFTEPFWNGDLGYNSSTFESATFCGTKSSCHPICLSWQAISFPDSVLTDTVKQITCAQQSATTVKSYIAAETQKLIAAHRSKFLANYQTNCLKGASLLDTFSISYPLGYYHYTLYYYDRAGNLVKTVPPKGVDESTTSRGQHPSHTYVTEYTPNSLKQVVRQKTPDGGQTRFWYDNKSRLRFSQNAKQLVANNYSYTLYDNLGRITEVGELHNLDTAEVNSQTYPSTGSEQQRTITVYSNAASGISYFNNLPQRYLQNRVSYSYTDVDGNLATTTDKVSTYFSYDPHGNVEWVIQEQPQLGKTYIAYQYDVISGSVLQVNYNEALSDKFFHRYTYDSDKRIKTVETSTDGQLWTNDATYTYYPHGPLKRTVIGKDSVQGTDYVYTIQGWLKAMNHSSLDVNNDPAHDGQATTAHQYTAKDVFGMVLGYYAGDFNRTGAAYNSGATYALNGSNLFNGNISSWTSNIGYVSGTLQREQLTGTKYRYDELNRITLADFNYYNSGWNDTSTYDESFAYDPNGNITSLTRNGYNISGVVSMDNLTYNYNSGNNQLNHVDDAVTSAYGDDIDDQSSNNYSYDSIGNLTADVAEGIDSIYWNVYGKISDIKKTNGDSLHFLYNAAGQRIMKEVIPNTTPHEPNCTYYSTDASGNAMAIYERTNSGSSPNYTATIKLAEQPIYGSERIGERRDSDITIATLAYTSSTQPQASAMAVQHVDTLSALNLPITNFTLTPVHLPFGITYYMLTNYTGVEQLSTNATASINSTVLYQTAYAAQGRYSVKLKNNCGKTMLSANSATLQTFINRPSPPVTQVAYLYDEDNHYLINSSSIKAGNQSQMAFLKVPGSTQQYYLFTIGSDKKAYYHVIDIAQKKVISKNNLLDANGQYGCTMKVLEDLVSGDGNSQLYLRRMNATNDSTYIMHFEITEGGIANGQILTKFVSKDKDGIGEIELNPDATKLLVANTKGGWPIWWWNASTKTGELKQFTLNTTHDTITASNSVSFGNFTGARSVAYNAGGSSIYYNKSLFGMYALNKYDTSLTSSSAVIVRNAAGDVRRGNNDKLYTSKVGTPYVYQVTDGGSVDSLMASATTFLQGGLQMNKHTLTYGLNCEDTDYFTSTRMNKAYELKDHLGNVRVVINDMKLWDDLDNDDIPDGGEFRDSVLSYNNYYAFGSIQPGRAYNPTTYRYGMNGQEKDVEIDNAGNIYTAENWEYDSRLGRRWNTDPMAHERVEWTPYNAFRDNPIKNVDPTGALDVDVDDDVTLNGKGEVTKVVENDKPNRFFDEKGKELKFNDEKDLDSPMLTKLFEVGDKVFEPISRKETQKALDDAGTIDFKKVNKYDNTDMAVFSVRYWWASHNSYDFAFTYLGPKLKVTDQQYLKFYEKGYVRDVPFIKFEGNNTLFNLPDAGNFMWGKKGRDNNVPASLLLFGAAANEGGEDTPADTKAILSGYTY